MVDRYLAPEYAENGIVSVRTDVYSFGIVLLQLISGRKVIDSQREEQQLLRQWVCYQYISPFPLLFHVTCSMFE